MTRWNPQPAWERVLARSEIGFCWLWQGVRTKGGYGRVGDGGVNRVVHRVVYEALVGPIPEGLDLDHLCRVRHCVNPDHLEPVTRVENVRRSTHVITHCKHGHPFDGFTGGQRKCSICMARWRREHQQRKRCN